MWTVVNLNSRQEPPLENTDLEDVCGEFNILYVYLKVSWDDSGRSSGKVSRCFLLVSCLHPEDGGNTFPRNVGEPLSDGRRNIPEVGTLNIATCPGFRD
jgi:hypothetical protein